MPQISFAKTPPPSSTRLSRSSFCSSQLYLLASALASAFLANRASLLASFLVSFCVCALCASSCLPSLPLAGFGWLRFCLFCVSCLCSCLRYRTRRRKAYLGSHGGGSAGIASPWRGRSTQCTAFLGRWRVCGCDGWFRRWSCSDGLWGWIAAECLTLT